MRWKSATPIRLDGLYNCLRQYLFMIGQLGCSVLPPYDVKGMLAIESEHKNISTWYNLSCCALN